MWLEAVLTKQDLEAVLRQFAPLTIRLGDGGRLLLAEPTEVLLFPEGGLGVVCSATVHWPILGFDVPVALNGLTLCVLPVVETTAAGSPLVFRLQIDHTGVAVLPAMLDGRVTAMINEELQRKRVELSWKFIETLSHEFGLPESLLSAASISLVARAGVVKATDKALGLAVEFTTAVHARSAAAGAQPPAVEGTGSATDGGAPCASSTHGGADGAPVVLAARPVPRALDALSFAVGGGVIALALTMLGGFVQLARRL